MSILFFAAWHKVLDDIPNFIVAFFTNLCYHYWWISLGCVDTNSPYEFVKRIFVRQVANDAVRPEAHKEEVTKHSKGVH